MVDDTLAPGSDRGVMAAGIGNRALYHRATSEHQVRDAGVHGAADGRAHGQRVSADVYISSDGRLQVDRVAAGEHVTANGSRSVHRQDGPGHQGITTDRRGDCQQISREAHAAVDWSADDQRCSRQPSRCP